MTLLLILWVACAILCAVLAPGYGRSAGAWAVLGLIFGIGAPIALIIMGDART